MIAAKPLKTRRAAPNRMARPDIYGFRDGRSALLFALAALFQNDPPTVLAPAFICRSALALSAAKGAQFSFYPVTENGVSSFALIEPYLQKQKPDALIVNHLFGHKPPERDAIYQYCKAHGIIVIDDMCHCPQRLFEIDADSDDDFDVRIFSFRKFLAVGAGGGLMLHSRFGVLPPSSQIALPAIPRLKRNLENVCATLSSGLYGLAHQLRRPSSDVRKLPDGSGWPASPEAGLLPHSIASILNDSGLMGSIKNRRIDNHHRLANALAGTAIKPLIACLPGDVPQNFPIRDPDGKYQSILGKARIYSFNWPGLELPFEVRDNTAEFASAITLAGDLLCLPIHQDVSSRQIDLMASLLCEAEHMKSG